VSLSAFQEGTHSGLKKPLFLKYARFGIAKPPEFPYETSPMPNLTKRDLVMSIADKTGLTQQEVFSVIQHTLDGIVEGLATGRDVELRNFGVFDVRLTKPRVGRNPKKPQNEVQIPPRAIVKFRAGKIMKARVLERTALLTK
jgi:nucleoid DNA-binding protein